MADMDLIIKTPDPLNFLWADYKQRKKEEK
jgi:hypothetical protein